MAKITYGLRQNSVWVSAGLRARESCVVSNAIDVFQRGKVDMLLKYRVEREIGRERERERERVREGERSEREVREK